MVVYNVRSYGPQATDDERLGRLATLVDPRQLELIILPTEKCNFRCFYCYEDFALGRMNRETIDAIKQLIYKRSDHVQWLYLNWFGGEPLLAKKVVLEISAFAAKLAQEKPDFSCKGGITTNGYILDKETFLELVEAGLQDFHVTLDGPKHIHDKSRTRADGRGTFDRIWQNLVAIRETNISARVTVRVHFDKDTASLLDPLIKDLQQQFLSDHRFSVYFHSINRMGGPNDEKIRILSREERSAELKALDRKLHPDSIMTGEPPECGAEVCYAARPNSFVIRSDGTLGKCTVAFNDPRNNIGKLRPDGTLELNQRHLQLWLRGLLSLDPQILECPLIGLPTDSEGCMQCSSS